MITDWKLLLKNLKLNYIKQTAPGFFEQSGGYAYRVNPYSDKTANALTAAIEDFLNHIGGGEASRINSTGIPRLMGGELRWTKSNSRKGLADIRGTYNGRSLSVEVKIGADRQSPAQVAEMHRIRNAGGLYFIAKDFPSFLTWFIESFPDSIIKLQPYLNKQVNF